MLCTRYFKWDLSKSECCINLHSSLWKKNKRNLHYTDETFKSGNILQVFFCNHFQTLGLCRTLWSNICQLSLVHSSIKPLTRKFPTFSLLHHTSNHHNHQYDDPDHQHQHHHHFFHCWVSVVPRARGQPRLKGPLGPLNCFLSSLNYIFFSKFTCAFMHHGEKLSSPRLYVSRTPFFLLLSLNYFLSFCNSFFAL